jgi:hexokinase
MYLASKCIHERIQKTKSMNVKVTALVNDTVGTLIAHSYTDPSTYVGVILGTGSNAAYYEKIQNIPKWNLPYPASQHMVINMEWGAFDEEGVILPTTRYDSILDRHSAHPRSQSFEKLISGMYLGEITRLVLVDLISTGEIFGGKCSNDFLVPYSFETANMSRIER